MEQPKGDSLAELYNEKQALANKIEDLLLPFMSKWQLYGDHVEIKICGMAAVLVKVNF